MWSSILNMLLVLISVKASPISAITASTSWKYRVLPNPLFLLLLSGVQDAAKGPPEFNCAAHGNKYTAEWKWSFCHIYSFQHLFTFQTGTKGQSTL